MKILGIGESFIEKAYITKGKTVPRNGAGTTNIGGPVLTSMILLARLGHETSFITTLGHDKETNSIKETLFKEHVHVYCEYKEKTKINTILINPTTGQRIKLRGRVKHPTIKNLDPFVIRQYDIIIIDRQHEDAFFEVMKHKKPSAKIILAPFPEPIINQYFKGL